MNEMALLQPKTTEEAAVEAYSNRQAQEVQAAMVIAKRFPRNEERAQERILRGCKRRSLAEQALYAYPKGGLSIEGPSIRLAEELARNWGNMDFGIVELEQRIGESTVMAYAWDLETNVRETKIFTVKHERKAGQRVYPLTDPREIYEMTANQGARRLRACILGIVPGDIQDAALAQINETLRTIDVTPKEDRIGKMMAAFAEMQVTTEMLEQRLGHKMESTNETELVNLRKVYSSLRDGMSKRSDWFKVDSAPPAPAEVPAKPKRGRKPKAEPAMAPDPFAPAEKEPTQPSAAVEQRRGLIALNEAFAAERGLNWDGIRQWWKEMGRDELESASSFSDVKTSVLEELHKQLQNLPHEALNLMRQQSMGL